MRRVAPTFATDSTPCQPHVAAQLRISSTAGVEERTLQAGTYDVRYLGGRLVFTPGRPLSSTLFQLIVDSDGVSIREREPINMLQMTDCSEVKEYHLREGHTVQLKDHVLMLLEMTRVSGIVSL